MNWITVLFVLAAVLVFVLVCRAEYRVAEYELRTRGIVFVVERRRGILGEWREVYWDAETEEDAEAWIKTQPRF